MIDFEDINEEEYDNSIPYEFDGNEEFYNFLVDNNIYEKYIINFNNYNYKYKKLYPLNRFLEEISKYNFIYSAFVWDDTKDGFGFWKKYNIKWIKYLAKNKNNFWKEYIYKWIKWVKNLSI